MLEFRFSYFTLKIGPLQILQDCPRRHEQILQQLIGIAAYIAYMELLPKFPTAPQMDSDGFNQLFSRWVQMD